MAQSMRPISTITDNGNFTGPSAHGSVDGTEPDTGDYWNGHDDQEDTLEVLLTDLSSSTPASGTCTVRVYQAESNTNNAPASAGRDPTYDIEVYEGVTQRAIRSGITATESAFTLDDVLTFASDDITDWSDLRVRFFSHGDTGGGPAAPQRGVAASFIEISVPDAGGTEFTQTVGGSVAPSGALVRQTQKELAGSVAPAGALVKETQKSVDGSVAPAGALVKETQKPISGSVAPSGALTTSLIFLQNVAGSIAPVGALTKQIQKLLIGSVAPAGALVKETQKSVDGSVAPSGALATSLVFLQSVAGAIAPVGSLATQFIAATVQQFTRRFTSMMDQLRTGSRRR